MSEKVEKYVKLSFDLGMLDDAEYDVVCVRLDELWYSMDQAERDECNRQCLGYVPCPEWKPWPPALDRSALPLWLWVAYEDHGGYPGVSLFRVYLQLGPGSKKATIVAKQMFGEPMPLEALDRRATHYQVMEAPKAPGRDDE